MSTPYWRNDSDYAFTEGLSPDRWVWEFLRRNPKYREDWYEKLVAFQTAVAEGRAAAVVTDPDDPHFAIWNLHHEAFEKWRLFVYLNPSQDEPEHLGFVPEMVAAATVRKDFPTADQDGSWQTVEIQLTLHNAAIRFNLRQPLKRLLQHAKFLLERFQAEFKAAGGRVRRGRTLPRKWRLYLRCLDARSDGATYESMAEVFFPADTLSPNEDSLKKIDDTLRQARRMLRPSSYERILA